MADLNADYRLLDVEPGASPRRIRAAFRRQARQWHPDRFTSDPERQRAAHERMQAINSAYARVRRAPLRFRVPRPPPARAAEPAEHVASSPPPPERRLTREEIETLVRALGGTASPLELAMDVGLWLVGPAAIVLLILRVVPVEAGAWGLLALVAAVALGAARVGWIALSCHPGLSRWASTVGSQLRTHGPRQKRSARR